jgi:O-antigen/teichoic acid export membrane protein
MALKFGKVDVGISHGIKSSYKSILLMYFVSMLSVFAYSSFESLDRLMMVNELSKEMFGNYYFIYNFLMAPTAILVSYYSMQRLHLYKKRFSYKEMTNDVVKISIYSMGMTIILLGVLILLREYKFINIQGMTMDVLIFVSILCVVKHGYSMLSMSYSIVASKKSMISISLFFGFVSVVVTNTITEFEIAVTVIGLMSLAIVMWLTRVLMYFYAIKIDSLKMMVVNE